MPPIWHLKQASKWHGPEQDDSEYGQSSLFHKPPSMVTSYVWTYNVAFVRVHAQCNLCTWARTMFDKTYESTWSCFVWDINELFGKKIRWMHKIPSRLRVLFWILGCVRALREKWDKKVVRYTDKNTYWLKCFFEPSLSCSTHWHSAPVALLQL